MKQKYDFIPRAHQISKVILDWEVENEAIEFIEKYVLPELPKLRTQKSLDLDELEDKQLLLKCRVKEILGSRGYFLLIDHNKLYKASPQLALGLFFGDTLEYLFEFSFVAGGVAAIIIGSVSQSWWVFGGLVLGLILWLSFIILSATSYD